MSIIVVFCMIIAIEAVFEDCFPCERVSCPQLSQECKYFYHDNCGCCPYCVKSDGEKCGGIMNLWGSCGPDSKCVYRLGSVFNEERFGFCENLRCSSLVCGYRQRCYVDATSNAVTCLCPNYRCKGKSNTVCGNDGITYDSICAIQEVECTKGYHIGIMHTGVCDNIQPCNDDNIELIGWNITTEVPLKRCVFNGKVYLSGQAVDVDDPCLIASCSVIGHVLIIPIPGCRDNQSELDYQVEYPPVYSWSSWSEWSGTCTAPCDIQRRSRRCVNVKYESVEKQCSDKLYYEERLCHDNLCDQ